MKLENILIDSDMELRICDFGFSTAISNLNHTNKGTNGYMAPEIYS
jgi:serine/threonine protein kinase